MGVLLLGVAVAALLACSELAIRTAFLTTVAERLTHASRPRWPSLRDRFAVRTFTRVSTRGGRARAGHM